jgi:hypothetical protein
MSLISQVSDQGPSWPSCFIFPLPLPVFQVPLPCAPLFCGPIYQSIVFDFLVSNYYFLLCIIIVTILSVHCLVPCLVFLLGPSGLLAACPLMRGRVDIAFIERRLSLLSLLTIFYISQSMSNVKALCTMKENECQINRCELSYKCDSV